MLWPLLSSPRDKELCEGVWQTPAASSQWSSLSADLTEQKAMSAHLEQEGRDKACQLPGPSAKHACRMPLGWGWWAVPGGETGKTEAGAGWGSAIQEDPCASLWAESDSQF